jgi:hypothetical protein
MGHDNQSYKNIARFDSGIAERWWIATGGNVRVRIDKEHANDRWRPEFPDHPKAGRGTRPVDLVA